MLQDVYVGMAMPKIRLTRALCVFTAFKRSQPFHLNDKANGSVSAICTYTVY